MATVERVCPQCGTSNPSDRSRCAHCGANLTHLPARRPNDLPERVGGARTAALVLSATALIARAGFRLFRSQVLPWLSHELSSRPPTIIDHKPSKRAAEEQQQRAVDRTTPEPEPDYTIRGWRAWSVRQGDEESSGSDTFEWRISRRRDGGAGRE